MKKTSINKGFTLVELLISLAIMAILFVAIGSSFDMAFKSYEANTSMNDLNMVHRNIIHQLSSAIRTAYNDPEIATIEVSLDGNTLSLTDSNARELQYRYSPDTSQLLVSIDGGDEYVVLENISPVNSSTKVFILRNPPLGSGLASGTVGRVEINFRSTHNEIDKVISTAVIPRNVIYSR